MGNSIFSDVFVSRFKIKIFPSIDSIQFVFSVKTMVKALNQLNIF